MVDIAWPISVTVCVWVMSGSSYKSYIDYMRHVVVIMYTHVVSVYVCCRTCTCCVQVV